ncbi:MAG TPA: M20/M25/M40 family metallo-hydrolase [Gemmatimonadales bacterium]|nr:M20/M25/M40 family metallo-hydrolase [Gemmatimonadales bacterium]
MNVRIACCVLGVACAVAAPVAAQRPVTAPGATVSEAQQVVSKLVESYGVSGTEGPVRDAVRSLLPAWAHPVTDSAGNLWLTVGSGAPKVVFLAHLDEIGFAVTAIRDDGTLKLRARGGFIPSLFEAQPALVHTGTSDIPAVFLPRDSVGRNPSRGPGAIRADPGTGSMAATEALGIRVGSTLTMPKSYARLLGTRATGRSFDDRVGSAALILAVRHIDPRSVRHAVAFVWTTREEIGLEGAAVVADSLKDGPAVVLAIDTFVSSDSPLEITTFADAPVGRGPVARAVDNSSVTPPALVDSLVATARRAGIPFQVGATNGGNDGSTFAAYGVPDAAMGWPLRYSHSPAEVIDLKDLVGLAGMVGAVARSW